MLYSNEKYSNEEVVLLAWLIAGTVDEWSSGYKYRCTILVVVYRARSEAPLALLPPGFSTCSNRYIDK
jgi:hypothetical protein